MPLESFIETKQSSSSSSSEKLVYQKKKKKKTVELFECRTRLINTRAGKRKKDVPKKEMILAKNRPR